MTDDDEPRAYTAKEMREFVLAHLQSMAWYWARIPIKTDEERAYIEQRGGEARWRTEGMLFSFLVMLDGCTNLPAFDLIPSPHPEDEAYHREEGSNWWVPIVINDEQLHGHERDDDPPEGPYKLNEHAPGLWSIEGPRESVMIHVNDAALADRITLLLNITER